jgi:mono/diheme cytochrome c family protein
MKTQLLAIALLAAAGAAQAQPAGNAVHGRKLYMADGCWQCHGTSGEGGTVFGPKLAPEPLPFEAVLGQLRAPRARMPVYTAKVLPDAGAADIYAYLKSIAPSKKAADIPLLNQN